MILQQAFYNPRGAYACAICAVYWICHPPIIAMLFYWHSVLMYLCGVTYACWHCCISSKHCEHCMICKLCSEFPKVFASTGGANASESTSASIARQTEAIGPAAVATVQAIQATAVGQPPFDAMPGTNQQPAEPSSQAHLQAQSQPSDGLRETSAPSESVLEEEPGNSEGASSLLEHDNWTMCAHCCMQPELLPGSC